MKSLSIEEIVLINDDHAIISVRCCRGKIKVKDAFFLFDSPSEVKPINKITGSHQLMIVGISLYGNDVTELDEGLTAELMVESTVYSFLKSGLYLNSQ